MIHAVNISTLLSSMYVCDKPFGERAPLRLSVVFVINHEVDLRAKEIYPHVLRVTT